MIPGEQQGSWLARFAPRLVAGALALAVLGVGVYLLAIGWDYYLLPIGEQGAHPGDRLLRSSGRYGVTLGVVAAGLMGVNVLYLVRRNLPSALSGLGSLRAWMTLHVATGLAAPVVALLHSAFTLRTPLGVCALLFLATAALAGIVGRYVYSVVPRGASGRELELAQVREAAGAALDELEGELEAGAPAQAQIRGLLQAPVKPVAVAWIGARIAGLIREDLQRRRQLAELRRRLGSSERATRVLGLVEQVLRLRAQARQHTELNRLMGSWRAAHRWFALTSTLLLLGHVYVAITYAHLW